MKEYFLVNVTGIGIGIKVNVTGIRIGIGIIEFAKHWNRNWNRNHGFWKTLESESESESALVESELESESLVPESFTTLFCSTEPNRTELLVFLITCLP